MDNVERLEAAISGLTGEVGKLSTAISTMTVEQAYIKEALKAQANNAGDIALIKQAMLIQEQNIDKQRATTKWLIGSAITLGGIFFASFLAFCAMVVPHIQWH